VCHACGRGRARSHLSRSVGHDFLRPPQHRQPEPHPTSPKPHRLTRTQAWRLRSPPAATSPLPRRGLRPPRGTHWCVGGLHCLFKPFGPPNSPSGPRKPQTLKLDPRSMIVLVCRRLDTTHSQPLGSLCVRCTLFSNLLTHLNLPTCLCPLRRSSSTRLTRRPTATHLTTGACQCSLSNGR
jgi:hypothetical protein